METHDARLVTPFKMVLAGPSGSRKSQFIIDMLTRAQQVMTQMPDHVVYCYGATVPDNLGRHIIQEFRQGVPTY